ncbi:S8/S53 family peptidase [Hymenobacter fodinae]|uniref:Peptidase S8/S53 domain-containing protein n=1 Tax=Hymenobacter fodinae TaxID=2510796 RepID=A0A4Z0P1P2_9BACT|nr:S8/S53 family peptidase [Hymenobacter fodinae]TGE03844.1 hypothetical protein EU556_24875 [Hymenobacter fodinae]
MCPFPSPVTGLLVEAAPSRTRGTKAGPSAAPPRHLADLKFKVEPLQSAVAGTRSRGPGSTPTAGRPARYLAHTPVVSDMLPWDLAHAYRAEHGSTVGFVEPDLPQDYTFQPDRAPQGLRTRSFGPDKCDDGTPYSGCWPHPSEPRIWHLDDDFSQLRAAREYAQQGTSNAKVRIAHLDTGYSPTHLTCPQHLDTRNQRDFVDGGTQAYDRGAEGTMLNPGHGTATLALLAGGIINPAQYGFAEELGGAPFAEVLPLRISASVVLWRTSSFVQALEHLVRLPPADQVQIITMSMGGLASRAWADAVNRAYEAGIFIVTAAGNNMGNKTPRHLVYPARFGRVVAACGACYDSSPYNRRDNGTEMQGNYGPLPLMRHAMAAYTPNLPWAKMADAAQIDLDGAGTSSATPQVAAAAACYWRRHEKELQQLPAPWMRVEAVRRALFSTAGRSTIITDDEDHDLFFGHGLLRARAALEVPVPAPDQLQLTPADEVHFPIFNVLFREAPPSSLRGEGATRPAPDSVAIEMLTQELLQLTQQHHELEELLGDQLLYPAQLARPARNEFIERVLAMHESSQALRTYLKSRA